MRIDDLVRTERYFTSTILGHILLANDLGGVDRFLALLAEHQIIPKPANRWARHEGTQVITELAPTRDVLAGRTLEYDFSSSTRDVIDVVLVVGDRLVAIEAKFFQRTNVASVRRQLATQRTALNVFLGKEFGIREIVQVFLTADDALTRESLGAGVAVLRWSQIQAVAASELGADSYVVQRLDSALRRHRNEIGHRGSKTDWQNLRTLAEVLKIARSRGSEVEVGFIDGIAVLRNRSLAELRARPSWKVRDSRGGGGARWIRGDRFAETVAALPETGFATRAAALPSPPTSRRSLERLSFVETISLCVKRRDDVLIGVNGGGARALRALTTQEISARRYPWQLASDGYTGLTRSNWMVGSLFLAIVREKGLSV